MEKSQTALEILAYMAEHPDAQDTLEGIMDWWLLERKIRRQTVKVKAALAELVAMKLVLEHKGRDSRTHYRMNPRKATEIRALRKLSVGELT